MALVALHAAAALLLAVWGMHRVWQLVDALRAGRHRHGDVQPTSWPTVTVQLPLYNERTVAARAVDAMAQLVYPAGKLDIQILDDSTDDTVDVVAERVRHWSSTGVNISHVRRAVRTGFKAGALENGMRLSSGEAIAVFDADFVPEPDFLTSLVPELVDGRADMVQARWEHDNRDENLLTRAQAACLDAHFSVEHEGRSARGRFFNFNGTAGVWRRAAIEKAGGWDAATLTEDLDLSLRAFLSGARFVYRDDVAARAELPGLATSFLGQQHRWAKGSMQTARQRLPDLWRAPLTLRSKLDVTMKLTQNVAFLWLALVVVTLPFLSLLRGADGGAFLMAADLLALSFATLPVVMHLVVSGLRRGRRLPAIALDVVLAFLLGAALSLHNARAVVAGFLDVGDRTFHRTPKAGDAEISREKSRLPSGAVTMFTLGASHVVVAMVLLERGAFHSVPLLLFFGVGLLFLGGKTIGESIIDPAMAARFLSMLKPRAPGRTPTR